MGNIYHALYTFENRYTNITMFTHIEKECKDAGVKYSGLNPDKIIHFWDEMNVQAGDAPPQFMPMLELSRKSLASDFRDKVDGLMGLMPREVASRVQPNYEQEHPEDYIFFAKAVISAGMQTTPHVVYCSSAKMKGTTNTFYTFQDRSLEILEQCTSPNPFMPS